MSKCPECNGRRVLNWVSPDYVGEVPCLHCNRTGHIAVLNRAEEEVQPYLCFLGGMLWMASLEPALQVEAEADFEERLAIY